MIKKTLNNMFVLPHQMSIFYKAFVLMATVVAISTNAQVRAADVPGMEKMVLLNAREQPVDLFVQELFGKMGIPVKVDEGIIGSVNGDFRKTGGEVISEILAAFQLAVYYDGALAYVYPANEIHRKMIYMPKKSARLIEQAARKLGLTDSRNTLSASDVGLVVTGVDRFVEHVDRLAGAMNKENKPVVIEKHDTYRIFKLKYAWADDVSLVIGGESVVVPGVASIIRSLIEPGSLAEVPSISRTRGTGSLNGLRGQGLAGTGVQAVGARSVINSDLASVDSVGATISADGSSTASTRIVADPLSNSVIIRDRADRMASYDALIQSLDKEPQMIEIEATIIDLDTDKMRELGINWRLQSGDSQALLGNGTASDDLLRPGSDVSATGNGGVVSLILGSRQQFISRIRALETQGAARIVSKPHVMTLSNVEALLDTTSTFFVRVAGQEEVDLFDVKVGTRLRVTPHVYQNGERNQIKLRVSITDGSTSDDQVDSIPVIEESNINTQAIVDVGQSLLIGGLVREIKSNGVSRVPVLGRIPVLGALFRTQTKTSTRQERMFLITPRISSRHAAGKRFSAPVLSGNENEIIQSAGTRMQATRQSLDFYDDLYPVQQQLPLGESLRTRQTVASPLLETVPSSIEPEHTIPDESSAGVLRRRLRPQNPQRELSEDELMVNRRSSSVAPVQAEITDGTPVPDANSSMDPVNAVVEQPGHGEWQVVGAPSVTVRVVEPTTRNATSMPAVEDGWQVITQ